MTAQERPRTARLRALRCDGRPRQAQALPPRALSPRGRVPIAGGVRDHRIGAALPPGSDDEFRAKIRSGLEESVDDLDADVLKDLLGRLTFQTSDADDGKDLAAAVRKAHDGLGDDSRT